jgi:hypothetical protein
MKGFKNCLAVAVVVMVTALSAGSIWAQDSGAAPWGGKKNFISADVGLIVGGARYERFLTPRISIGVDGYWSNSFIIWNEIEAGVFGRYYLWKGLYGELGLGYHSHSGTEDVESGGLTVTGVVTTSGFAVTPGVGWKFDPGKAGGFFVEPGVSVPITIGDKSYWLGSIPGDFGVSVGFVLYCGLGWAL